MNNPPYFLIIGSAKAATTSLFDTLSKHPEIHLPPEKELNYFSDDKVFARGYSWYYERFADVSVKIIGEASVSYSMKSIYPNTARRIYENNPKIKIIYVVREPLSRLISLYRQLQVSGVIGPVTFEEALQTDLFLLDSAKYWEQISEYRCYFPDSQIKIIFFEDLIFDTRKTIENLLEFINVDSTINLPFKKNQGTATKNQMMHGQLSWLLRSIPGSIRAKNILPNEIKRRVVSVLKKDIREDPEITNSTLQFLQQELTADLNAFLEFYDRVNYWKFDNITSKLSS